MQKRNLAIYISKARNAEDKSMIDHWTNRRSNYFKIAVLNSPFSVRVKSFRANSEQQYMELISHIGQQKLKKWKTKVNLYQYNFEEIDNKPGGTKDREVQILPILIGACSDSLQVFADLMKELSLPEDLIFARLNRQGQELEELEDDELADDSENDSEKEPGPSGTTINVLASSSINANYGSSGSEQGSIVPNVPASAFDSSTNSSLASSLMLDEISPELAEHLLRTKDKGRKKGLIHSGSLVKKKSGWLQAENGFGQAIDYGT